MRKIGTGCLLTMTTCRCGSLRQSFRAVRRARATWVLAAMRIAGGKGEKMKSEKEEILFTCEFCKRKITKEVLDVMEEGSEYCDCEKSFKIIELEKEQKATRQQTRTETLKDVLKSLDRINDYCYETSYLVLEYFRKWLEKEVQK